MLSNAHKYIIIKYTTQLTLFLHKSLIVNSKIQGAFEALACLVLNLGCSLASDARRAANGENLRLYNREILPLQIRRQLQGAVNSLTCATFIIYDKPNKTV